MTASLVLLAVAALALGGAMLSRRRRPRADSRVRLYEMMRLRGVLPPGLRDPAAAHDAAAAKRRCVACSSKQLCDELLRAGGGKGYSLFCPNALYVEWLRSTSLRFD
jgi:hypothetical protein